MRTSSVPKEDVFPRLLYCNSRCSKTCRWHSQVLPSVWIVLSGALRCSQTYHTHSNGTSVPVIRDPSYSEGQPECPPSVRYSSEIDSSKFTLHFLSHTPGGFQWLKYICWCNVGVVVDLRATLLGMHEMSLWIGCLAPWLIFVCGVSPR